MKFLKSNFIYFLALTSRYCYQSWGYSSYRNYYRSFIKLQSIIKMSSLSSSDPSSIDTDALVHNLRTIQSSIDQITESKKNVRLVAVSKTKPSSCIEALYSDGHRVFGENYYQELAEKAQILPKDIQWHFIGHLQSSKASKLIKDVPNLSVLETIDSLKLARKIQNACVEHGNRNLDCFLQVDTSNEETKSGFPCEDVDNIINIVRQIQVECPNLQVKGFMTIGAPGDLTCFDKLVNIRTIVAQQLGRLEEDFELSMGMSGDFEEAIKRGATSVRVGSTIFGARIYPSNIAKS